MADDPVAWIDNDLNLRMGKPRVAGMALYAHPSNLQARIDELEAVIKSHGIPVKTYTGGVAHYCMGDKDVIVL